MQNNNKKIITFQETCISQHLYSKLYTDLDFLELEPYLLETLQRYNAELIRSNIKAKLPIIVDKDFFILAGYQMFDLYRFYKIKPNIIQIDSSIRTNRKKIMEYIIDYYIINYNEKISLFSYFFLIHQKSLNNKKNSDITIFKKYTNVGEQTIYKTLHLINNANKQEIEQLKKGELSISKAYSIIHTKKRKEV